MLKQRGNTAQTSKLFRLATCVCVKVLRVHTCLSMLVLVLTTTPKECLQEQLWVDMAKGSCCASALMPSSGSYSEGPGQSQAVFVDQVL
jgi:hypothetical protein